MKEAPGKNVEPAKSEGTIDSTKRLYAKVKLQKALDSMARLRATIDRRPGRLNIQERKR